MNLCTICQLPVLELDGQFENLEPYYAEADDPAAELAGECHSSCISTHEFGHIWHEWRLRNYSTVRGYRVVAEQDGWSVLVHARHAGFLAFHTSGFSVVSEPRTKSGNETIVNDGLLVPIDDEFNLRLDNREIIDELKSGLIRDQKYPIPKVLSMLGIADRIKWPQALGGAVFVLDSKLQREWTSTTLAMRAHYQQFIPAPIVQFWRNPK